MLWSTVVLVAVSQLPVLTFLRPSVLIGRSPRLKLAACLSAHRGLPASVGKIPSASSQALPAPNPVPNHTGHVLRLNRSTENMTPKENPSVDRTTKEEIARSHCNNPGSVTHQISAPCSDGNGGTCACGLQHHSMEGSRVELVMPQKLYRPLG
jgi:hypothetical protein